MHTMQRRGEVKDAILTHAREDRRIIAGALIGSAARAAEDPWSDVDLTFAVSGNSVAAVLTDWTHWMRERFNAVALFDVDHDYSTYRVFLLPDCLEVDLSFTPEAHFGARGEGFALLFGTAGSPRQPAGQRPDDLLGHAVHHALHVRASIERHRQLEAEYWLAAMRHLMLRLACMQNGISGAYGKGFDQAPPTWRAYGEQALPRSLAREELERAFSITLDMLEAHIRENERFRLLSDWLSGLRGGS